MEILVAILIIAVIAAVAFAVIQGRRRPSATGVDRRAASPSRRAASAHPMADVVADHMQATGPQEIVAAEQRMHARAQQVAAGLHASNGSGAAAGYSAPAADATYGAPVAADAAYGTPPAAAPAGSGRDGEEQRLDGQIDSRDTETVPDGYDGRAYDGRRAEDGSGRRGEER